MKNKKTKFQNLLYRYIINFSFTTTKILEKHLSPCINKGIKKHEYYTTNNTLLGCIEGELFSTKNIFNEHTKSIIELLCIYASKGIKFIKVQRTMSIIEQQFHRYKSIEIIEGMKHAIKTNKYKVDFKILPLLIEIVNSFLESKEKKKLALECLLNSYQVSPQYIGNETMNMVDLVFNQGDHDLVLISLELLQILPVGIYHQGMLDKIFEIDYKNYKELSLILDTSKAIYEKTGYESSDYQAKFMLNIVTDQIQMNDDSKIKASYVKKSAYDILESIIENNNNLSLYIQERFQLEELIHEFPKFIDSDNKQVLLILQEIKRNLKPTLSIYGSIMAIIEKLIYLDNDNEIKTLSFEIFHKAININK